MWARNILFLATVAAAVVALIASVFPTTESSSRQAMAESPAIDSITARVDAAFETKWRDEHIEPAARADDLTIARRLALALTGTIPSLEEIRNFETLAGETRVSRFLAGRLADRRSADYLAERLARAYVGTDDGQFLLFRRRRFVAWLAEQLATNTPYDELTRRMIADSGLWTDTPSTNFITIAIEPGSNKPPEANKLAARVSRAFLGVRLDCAECHNHPFEPWTQRDFQSLAAFFGRTRQSLRGIRDIPGAYRVENRQTGDLEIVKRDVPFGKELLPKMGAPREQLAVWVTHPKNRAFAREAVNRAWAILFGRPLVEPIDNLNAQASLPEALDLLADDFVEHGFDWRRLLEVIASTRAFQLDSKLGGAELSAADSERRERAWAVFPLTRLRSEQVIGALLQSASLTTIDADSNILTRIAREIGQRDFVKRYGDAGADEFEPHGGTIPQRLLMMNGKIVHDKTKDSLLFNSATQIAALTSDHGVAVDTAMLTVLTRRASKSQLEQLINRVSASRPGQRQERIADLVWTMLNSTEFSWNH